MMFSVIVPIYNIESYLAECLDSILSAAKCARELCEIEVICVDDGSTDRSGVIADDFAKRLNAKIGTGLCQIKVMHQQNSGVCAARNVGLDAASGTWIMFVDGDDLISPCTFELFAKAIAEDPDADMVRCGVKRFSKQSETIHCATREAGFSSEDVSERIGARSFYGYFCLGAFRSDVHGTQRFGVPVRLKIGEDNLFYIQSLELARRIVFVDAELYYYRQREGSAFNSHRDVAFWRNDFEHYYQVLKIFNSSKKAYDRAIVREYSMRTTEGYSDLLPPKRFPESLEKWLVLVEFYGKVNSFRALPFWFRFVTRICYNTGSRFVYCLLCRLPRRLKLLGLHR